MKKLLSIIVLFTPTALLADTQISAMSIDEKCKVWEQRASDLVFEYFDGVSREYQYKKIDIAAKSDPEIELIMKKQVDGVYDHIPFVQNIEMRDYFQEGYAKEIYKTCINRYVTEKP